MQCISIESLIINILYSFEIIGKSKKKKKEILAQCLFLEKQAAHNLFFQSNFV